jgi:hypothetical protein
VDDTLGTEGVEDGKPWVVLLLEGETVEIEMEVDVLLLLEDKTAKLEVGVAVKLLLEDDWVELKL